MLIHIQKLEIRFQIYPIGKYQYSNAMFWKGCELRVLCSQIAYETAKWDGFFRMQAGSKR